jgi:hypothetical protein
VTHGHLMLRTLFGLHTFSSSGDEVSADSDNLVDLETSHALTGYQPQCEPDESARSVNQDLDLGVCSSVQGTDLDCVRPVVSTLFK